MTATHGAVYRATRAEVDAMPERVRASALAVLALSLARAHDADPSNAATAREYRMTLAALHDAAPQAIRSSVDDIAARRAARAAGG